MTLQNIPFVIMAGGKGRRLRPYTISLPKPLVPIGDMPILEIVLRQLRKFGFRDITLTLGHLGELVEAYLSQNKGPISDLNYHFVHEQYPTGTAGSLGFMKNRLSSTFAVMNGDVLTDINYANLLAYHHRKKSTVTVATHKKKVKIEYGVLEENNDNLLVNYNEKPELEYRVAMGLSVMEPEVLDYVEEGEYLDIPSLLTSLISDGKRVALFHHPGEWLDIGNPDEYALAQDSFLANRELYYID